MQLLADFHAAQKALSHGFPAKVYQKYSTAWHQWRKFCKWLEIPADLHGIGDPIHLLQIFADRVSAGLLEARGIPIKKRSVEQYLCSIGQIFSAVGDNDPRHKISGPTEN